MSSLFGQAIRAFPAGPLNKVEHFLKDPIGTQIRVLRSLLKRMAGTEWGRRYGAAEILKERDVFQAFQARVPLHEFEQYRDDLQRVRRGEPDILWPGRFRHFAVSSGTASAGKVLPVSHEMLVHDRSFSLAAALNYLAQSRNPKFMLGRHLTLPGRIEVDPTYAGAQVGEVSGLVAEYAPGFFKRLYQAVPNEMAFLPNWERKLEAIVEHTMMQDIRMIVMVPSWALTLFRLLIERYNEKTGKNVSTVGEIWPNLQVFISGGVALSSYRSLLETFIGLDHLHFVETYGASEGFFAFQNDLADPSLLLHLDNGLFYEFVRMDELGSASPRRYTIADVEPDVRYTLYVTTCSGLWTYNVRDVLRFTSTSPYKIVVAGRSSEMLDKYGEAVFGEEAATALRHACETTGARVAFFHVSPRAASLQQLPTHQWLIEFEQSPASLTAFAAAIDTHLQSINRHYQIRREGKVFALPEIIPVADGTFYEWLKRTKKSISGQTKVPRMSEDRDVAEMILAIACESAELPGKAG